MLWGFFLKLMIADKAAVVVNEVFGNWEACRGGYVLVAGVLYSIQLYADFLSCVCLARGTAELFGIRLPENFRSPCRAESVKEFWGRWHISLSSWLRRAGTWFWVMVAWIIFRAESLRQGLRMKKDSMSP